MKIKSFNALLVLLTLAATPLFAAETVATETPQMDKTVAMANMKHANPMPNYMSTIKQNADALELNDEQKVKLQAWVDGHKPKAMETANKIVQMENELAKASMDNASKDYLMDRLGEILELRKQLASGKTDCRDHMRTILTTDQWNKLVELQAGKQ